MERRRWSGRDGVEEMEWRRWSGDVEGERSKIFGKI